MKVIIRSRDSGKAKELLHAAKEAGAIVLTQDKRAFQVKAKNLGFSDVEIVDIDDLHNDNYEFGKPLMIHNADKTLAFLMDYYYGLELVGFSATVSDE